MHIYLQKSKLNTTKITKVESYSLPKVKIIPRFLRNAKSVKLKALNKLMNTILQLIVQRKILLNKVMSTKDYEEFYEKDNVRFQTNGETPFKGKL